MCHMHDIKTTVEIQKKRGFQSWWLWRENQLKAAGKKNTY